jgi:endonuclease G
MMMNRNRVVFTVSGSILITLGLTLALGAWGKFSAVRAESTTIVIGEVQTRGTGGVNDEFVEVYNLSGSPVNLSGYVLRSQQCVAAGITDRYVFPAVTLQPYGHYLIVGTAYNGGTTGDGILLAGIGDCSQLQLQYVSTVIAPIDTLVFTFSGGPVPTGGWVGLEGAYFGNNPHNGTDTTNQDTSMARLPDTLSTAGGHKNGQDTDVNANDFMATTASSPENSSSPNAVTFSGLRASSSFLSLAAALLITTGFVILRKRK